MLNIIETTQPIRFSCKTLIVDIICSVVLKINEQNKALSGVDSRFSHFYYECLINIAKDREKDTTKYFNGPWTLRNIGQTVLGPLGTFSLLNGFYSLLSLDYTFLFLQDTSTLYITALQLN